MPTHDAKKINHQAYLTNRKSHHGASALAYYTIYSKAGRKQLV